MTSSSQRKGDNYERELSSYINEVTGLETFRAPMSGGGLVGLPGGSDILGSPGLFIEAKRTERLNPLKALEQAERNGRTFNFKIDNMESLQYLEYGPLNWFHWHVDNGDDNVDNRKLTAIIQLSEPSEYVGGNLQIKAQAPACQPPRGRGAVTIFPSHLLHRATPVLWGSRKVVVAWIRGTTPLR